MANTTISGLNEKKSVIDSDLFIVEDANNTYKVTKKTLLGNYALKTDLHSHANQSVLDGITDELISKWGALSAGVTGFGSSDARQLFEHDTAIYPITKGENVLCTDPNGNQSTIQNILDSNNAEIENIYNLLGTNNSGGFNIEGISKPDILTHIKNLYNKIREEQQRAIAAEEALDARLDILEVSNFAEGTKAIKKYNGKWVGGAATSVAIDESSSATKMTLVGIGNSTHGNAAGDTGGYQPKKSQIEIEGMQVKANADSADILKTTRTITFKDGDVAGSFKFNGSKNVDCELELLDLTSVPAEHKATANVYGPTANVTGNTNTSIVIPYIEIDKKGRVVKASQYTLTNRNDLVKSEASTSKIYLAGPSEGNQGKISNAYYKTGVYIEANASIIKATGFRGDLYGIADYATELETARTFKINGAEKLFDGSADVSWTLDEIDVYKKADVYKKTETYSKTEVNTLIDGCAKEGHNHNDLYYTETEMDTKLAGKLDTSHETNKPHISLGETSTTAYRGDRGKIAYDHSQSAHLSLGETSSTAYRGDRGKIAYDHSQSAHAPSNAQKNSDITKAEIEAKLTGTITSHNHSGTYAPVHDHPYVPTAGGTITGSLTVNSNLTTGAGYITIGGKRLWLTTWDPSAYTSSGDIWIKTI